MVHLLRTCWWTIAWSWIKTSRTHSLEKLLRCVIFVQLSFNLIIIYLTCLHAFCYSIIGEKVVYVCVCVCVSVCVCVWKSTKYHNIICSIVALLSPIYWEVVKDDFNVLSTLCHWQYTIQFNILSSLWHRLIMGVSSDVLFSSFALSTFRGYLLSGVTTHRGAQVQL